MPEAALDSSIYHSAKDLPLPQIYGLWLPCPLVRRLRHGYRRVQHHAVDRSCWILGSFREGRDERPRRPAGEFGEVMTSLPDGYRPSPDEEFMNPLQLEYFRRRLLEWKKQILSEAEGTLAVLQSEPLREPDMNDRASSETDWSIELRTRDRQRKLISKIDAALRRIDEGEYGYCEVTGEPISLGRLEARPIATMTLEAQERHERQEKISRDD